VRGQLELPTLQRVREVTDLYERLQLRISRYSLVDDDEAIERLWPMFCEVCEELDRLHAAPEQKRAHSVIDR
jgi:hypothetical protein